MPTSAELTGGLEGLDVEHDHWLVMLRTLRYGKPIIVFNVEIR